MALLELVPGERFTVKSYNSSIGYTTCLAFFFKAAAGDRKTSTILVGSGYDGSQEDLYHSAFTEIPKRGINCVTYEGPDQHTTRRNQNIGFIPDW
jgi:hypothetical protein